MIKNDTWIEQFGASGGILPFKLEQVNPASYDVSLGNHWIYLRDCGTCEDVWSDEFILYPGQVVLATTKEYIKLPRNVCCDLKLKSTLGRSWINHSLSGWIDPNFQGEITLELQNIGKVPYILKEGARVAQIIFMSMEDSPRTAYGEGGKGRYQGQTGATKPIKDC